MTDDRIAFRTTRGTPLLRYAAPTGALDNVVPFPSADARDWMREQEELYPASLPGDLPEPRPLRQKVIWTDPKTGEQFWATKDFRGSTFPHRDQPVRTKTAIELTDEEAEAFRNRVKQGPLKVKMGPPQKVKPWESTDLSEVLNFFSPQHQSDGTWYHASPHELPEGTVLTPGGAPAASKDFYDQGFGEDRGTLQDMGGGRAEHVWLSPNREDAGFWSAVNGAPHIYEVDPEEDPRPWNGTGTDGWVTPRATIRRKVATNHAARLALDYHSPYWGSPGWSNPRDEPQEFKLKDHLPSDMAWMGPGYGEYSGPPSSPYDQTQSGKWYHTSPYRLEPGTKLTPGGAPSPGGDDWYGRTYVNRPNHVWLSPNMDRAKGWRDWAGQHAYIYEVRPGDRPQPWNFDGEAGWVAPHATIKHEVDDEGNPVPHHHAGLAWHLGELDDDNIDEWGERIDPARLSKTPIGTPEKPVPIYRGLNIDPKTLPPELWAEIQENLSMPMEPEHVGRHFKVGPAILDHLQKSHWEHQRGYGDEAAGLGRHWTTRPSMADTAAWVGGGIPVRLRAWWDGSGADPTHRGENWSTMESENEVTMNPGAPLNIDSVLWGRTDRREVLHDPKEGERITKSYGNPYIGGPRQHTAAGLPQYEQFGAPETGNGRWQYSYRDSYPMNSYGDEMHRWHIAPTDSPATEESPHSPGEVIHYDPRRVHHIQHEDEFGPHRPRAVPNPGAITHWKDLPDPGNMLWRGMSHEEYEQAKQRGYFESNGSYNMGDWQKGKTFFSTGLGNAAHYATGFAPWQAQPTFSRPAHVIGIPDRPELPRGAMGNDPSSHEVGVPGRVPFNSITHHWVGNVAAIRPGLAKNNVDSSGRWGTPSRSLSPNVDVHWEAQHPGQRITAMPWYHNTDAELSPGDEILPASQRGIPNRWDQRSGYDPNFVYFYEGPQRLSEDPDKDINAVNPAFGKNIYEVEPQGEIQRDPEWESNKKSYGGDYEFEDDIPGAYDYVAPSAKVIRKYHPDNWKSATHPAYDEGPWFGAVWDEDLDEDDEAEEEHRRHAFAPPPTDDGLDIPEESKWEVPPLPGAKPHEFFHDWFEYCLQREQEEAAEAAQRHSYLGIEPDMNVQRQVRKFDRYIQQARDIGDHGLADYATHLKEQMLDGVANGRPQPFSYWIPMAEEEFG